MLEKRKQVPDVHITNIEYFIYCLEAVEDVEIEAVTQTQRVLEQFTHQSGIASIYKTCDTIEGLEESLNTLVLDDHHFKDYEIIYLIMTGEANSISLNGYNYSLIEIAELFEGRLRGKILHFSNAKVLDLDQEEAQYFLDITGAKAISGYGSEYKDISSSQLDVAFFNFFKEDDDVLAIVEELHQKYYEACRALDFRLYY